MQLILGFLFSLVLLPFKKHPKNQIGSAYDYTFTTLMTNEALPLSQFKGKVLLIVNTASECGFTPQYEKLQLLYDIYQSKGLVVLGVPSNDFSHQEPGSADAIWTFCQKNYGVTFPMTAKEQVIGKNTHAFYKWAHKVLGLGTAPKWNFHKYLIDRNGQLVDYFHPTTPPDSLYVVNRIKALLNQ